MQNLVYVRIVAKNTMERIKLVDFVHLTVHILLRVNMVS